jgi:WD40 repeat protein
VAAASAVARWAAAHASTFPPAARGAAAVPPGVTASGTAASGTAPHGRLMPDSVPVTVSAVAKIRSWDTGDAFVFAVAMGRYADGRIVVATAGRSESDGEADDPVRIWDVESGELLHILDGHTQDVHDATWGYTDDGQALLATASTDGTARIWDADAGECLRVITGDERSGDFYCLCWMAGSHGELLLAVPAGDDEPVRIWDQASGGPVDGLTAGGTVFDIASTGLADGQDALAVLTSDDDDNWQLEICKLGDGERQSETIAAGLSYGNIAWQRRPGGSSLLAAATTSGTSVWPVDGEGRPGTAVTVSPTEATALAWAPLGDDRALLATTSHRAGLQLWDAASGECLHTEALEFIYNGSHHVDWVFTADGRLLLAAATNDGRAHLWNVVLDPPPKPAQAARQRQTATARAEERGDRLVLPPREVTPEFSGAAPRRGAFDSVAAITTADGRTMLATTSIRDEIDLWDLGAGRQICQLEGHTRYAFRSAWGHASDGRLVLATAGGDATARIWDPATGGCLHVLTGHSARVNSVAWSTAPDEQPLLATGSGDGTAKIWDPGTGECLRTLNAHEDGVRGVTWAHLSGGPSLLATAGNDGTARIWDPGTGECLRTLTGHTDAVTATAWSEASDERVLLATASNDGTARIWDPGTGECLRTLNAHEDGVRSVTWAQTHAGRPLLATTGSDASAKIWNPDTGTALATVPRPGTGLSSVDWVRNSQGDLLLLVPDSTIMPSAPASPVHAWLVEAAADQEVQPPAGPADSRRNRLANDTRAQLLRLGTGGLWPPLGLLADLVRVTGPEVMSESGPTAPLCDPGLAVLAGEPGVARLRALAGGSPRWTADSRAAFAALLASALDIPERYVPPSGAEPAALGLALAQALAVDAAGEAADRGADEPWRVAFAELRVAATRITDQVITLLAILGPGPCTADPLLPVRLLHHVPQLPALSPRELRLLTAAGSRPGNGTSAMAAATVWSPGTAGVARNGPITRLLPIELALPRDLLTTRLAADQLLYRQHRAPVPSAPEPVTILLDTTPPTFGPAGIALRLAAHLITTTLWDHGRHPALVTLTEPRTVAEIRTPAELMRLWASATLDPPAAGLDAALRTAAGLGQPAVFCTHVTTARDHGYLPGPGRRLLTAHQPPERPPAEPASPWHAHLPPDPTPSRLALAIARLLTATAAAPQQEANWSE